MVDLFKWEEQEADINLSGSGIQPFEFYDSLKLDNREVEAILAEWYHVKEENVLITHGAQEAMFLTFIALEPKFIHVPLPSYPPIYDQAKLLGINVNFTGIKPMVEGSVIALANPNNPTGTYINLDDIVDKNLVIVDEIFKPYVDDEPYIHENVIVISSTSKFFGFKDRKVGWIIGKKTYIDKIRLARELITPAPIYDQILIKYAFKNYDYFKERSINIVKNNVDSLFEYNKYFKIQYNPYLPYALLIDKELDMMSFCRELLIRKGLLLTPSDFFGISGGMRISLGLDDRRAFVSALKKLNSFVEYYGSGVID